MSRGEAQAVGTMPSSTQMYVACEPLPIWCQEEDGYVAVYNRGLFSLNHLPAASSPALAHPLELECGMRRSPPSAVAARLCDTFPPRVRDMLPQCLIACELAAFDALREALPATLSRLVFRVERSARAAPVRRFFAAQHAVRNAEEPMGKSGTCGRDVPRPRPCAPAPASANEHTSAPDPPSGGPCPRCESIRDVRGLTDGMVRVLWGAARRWYEAKPWLLLRLNHVLRIDVPWAPSHHFAQVIGGAGQCDFGVYMARSQRGVQNETWGRKEWDNLGHSLYLFTGLGFDLSFASIEALQDLGVQPLTGSYDDPETCLTASFLHAVRTPDDHVRFLPPVPELAFAHAAAHAIAHVVERGLLCAVPGSPSGDYRELYPLDVRVPVPDAFSERGPVPASEAVARVRFPYTKNLARLSHLQCTVVSRVPRPASAPDQGGDGKTGGGGFTTADQEQLLGVTTLSCRAKDLAQRGEWAEAANVMAEALQDLPPLERMRRDEGASRTVFTVAAVAASCFVGARRWEEAVRAAALVTDDSMPMPDHVDGCILLWARLRAYCELNHLHDALIDAERCVAIARSLTHSPYSYDSRFDLERPPSPTDAALALERVRRRLREMEGKMHWERLSVAVADPLGASGEDPDGPRARSEHAAVLDPGTGLLWVLGGRADPTPAEQRSGYFDKVALDDVWRADVSQAPPLCWERVRPRNSDLFTAVHAHTAVLYGGCVWVLGGKSDSATLHDHMHVLHLERLEWERVPLPRTPDTEAQGNKLQNDLPYRGDGASLACLRSPIGSLHSHAACVVGGSMFVFGGCAPEPCAHLWRFEFETRQWELMPVDVHAPSARSNFSMWGQGGAVWVFGGEARGIHLSCVYLADLWRYDLEARAWSRVHTRGIQPTARAETQAVAWGEHNVLVPFGYAETAAGSRYFNDGLCLEVDEDASLPPAWHALASAQGVSPLQRAGASVSLDAARKRVIVVGGYCAMRPGPMESCLSGAIGDVWAFNISSTKRSPSPVQCESCGELCSPLRCSRCKAAIYCSAHCQKKAWPKHKLECASRKMRKKSRGV
eukprot:TRINITY_DN7493_c0_g2_i1.p1 TRINITY_DN7493_c0_g2~~TRINITY_DN7493_c0_g2_i1.p1  ORF type:complete len:1058 (+),score=205.14 TRINITY_DN7493_c0_g2_i1:102-3275(+)